MSAIIDPLDRTTAVLFGDGAGAVLLEPAEPGFGLLDFYHRVDGSGREDLLMPAGGSLKPASARPSRRGSISCGRTAGGVQVRGVADGRERQRLLQRTDSPPPTSPSSSRTRPTSGSSMRRRIAWGCRGASGDGDRPLRQHDRGDPAAGAGGGGARRRLTRGDLVVFVAVGAGFTVGATLVRWS